MITATKVGRIGFADRVLIVPTEPVFSVSALRVSPDLR
jgi:hypothetical protein